MIDQRSDTDRRAATERRKFSYDAHAPERRSGGDRRNKIDRRSGSERRKYHRFLTKDPTFVTLWAEHEKDFEEKDGQLLDISKGGIALRCTATPEESNVYSLLEVFWADKYNIAEIPFKMVSDIEMTGGSTSSELTLRRYGLQFEELTTRQMDKLEYFLCHHTIGEGQLQRS